MRAPRRSSPLVWLGLGLTLALLLLALLLATLNVQKSSMSARPPVIGVVADFTLTNQNGYPVTLADFKGKVWIADIIFTRCAGPCLRMSKQMSLLQSSISSRGVRLVSLTTDPDYDTPEVLQEYARRFNSDTNRWVFLTGAKERIAALASESLKLTGVEKKPEDRADPADLFIHSTIFVLVDKLARLRGVFETEGEGVDAARVRERILKEVRLLEREP